MIRSTAIKIPRNDIKPANYARFLFCIGIALAFALLPDIALAAGGGGGVGGGTPIESGLQWPVDLLTNGIARTVAILAIIGLGYFAWAGILTARHAGQAIGGIVLVFGASTLANLIISAV
jgi:type IV secretion system protein VirB2